MTQAEMEVEIKSLRGQIGQVQEQQEDQKNIGCGYRVSAPELLSCRRLLLSF